MYVNTWSEHKMWNQHEPGYKKKQGKHEMITEAWAKKKEEKEKKVQPASVDGKYRSLKVYMRDILKSSLITSFPEITLSKSWTKKLIKILVFLICVVGFTYQTLNFLWLYLSYPTVVNVLISNPFEIPQPAITICNRNRQRRSAYCDRPENRCYKMTKEKYCEFYPKSCPTRGEINTFVPFPGYLVQSKFSWNTTIEQAHNDSMIDYCNKVIEGKTTDCLRPYRPVPAVTAKGESNMCYAIETLWEKPEIEPHTYPNTFIMEMQIKTQSEEYLISTEPVLIQVAVHDRRKLVNPYAEGYSLKGGVQYEATVTMTEKRLLEDPYDTNCTNYLETWKKNNGTGPLNDLMCVEYCKLNTLLEMGECIDMNVAYPHMEKLCDTGVVTTNSSIIEACTKKCGKPCRDHQYDVRYEPVNNYDNMCKDDWCRSSKIKLTLYFKQFRVTKFQYQPKFESVEMFSYIGGYMGMWLGLSLVSLFDFLETIVYLLYFPIGHMKWKAKKKKVKTNLSAFHHDPYYGSHMY